MSLVPLFDAPRLASRISLAWFLRRAWPIVEPGRPLIWNWHIPAVCEHLEAVSNGEIRRLLITIPPNCSKSRMVAVYWPAWVWLNDPGHRWLFISASSTVTRDSLSCRRVILSDWYQREFQPNWKLAIDQNEKNWYETTYGGHRQAFGIGAGIIGKKGDTIVVDDPNDAQQVYSAAARNAVNETYDNSIYDRNIDLEHGAQVIIAHRTHQEDFIGHVKAQGGWFELCIPEAYVRSRSYVSPTGWKDPRKHDGELLRPKQYGPGTVDNMVRSKKLVWETKHQQNPRSPEGIRFKRKFFRYRWYYDLEGYICLRNDRGFYRFLPDQAVDRFITADGAASAKTTADFTAICSWIISPRYDLIALGCLRFQAEIPDQPQMLVDEYKRQRVGWAGIEGIAANVGLLQHARRMSMVIRHLTKHLDKLGHAAPAIILAEGGRIWLPDAPTADRIGYPVEDWLDEHLSFTGTKADAHDDMVDCTSYAVDRINEIDMGEGQGGGIAEPRLPGPMDFMKPSDGVPTSQGFHAEPGKPRQMIQTR